jgi:hypothetical protein
MKERGKGWGCGGLRRVGAAGRGRGQGAGASRSGVGGSRAALPATFWHPSKANCRGTVEVNKGRGVAEGWGETRRAAGEGGGGKGSGLG